MQTHENDLPQARIDLVRSRIRARQPAGPAPSRIDQILAAISLVLGGSLAAMAALTLR
ncbi:hypothetical protein [Roseomonas fluvialis]|uniref:Uncharacterized protein n=1 Tax=Roseomonas fluvialis TaxID=1750527 RepID=A0ABN6P2Y4_9PROT|nr:hypothetical protein [Roseomonas fluvialis]BDG73000.1 hypothetical protein Rmf_29290 [Roseomonas fluvialis]